VLGDNDGKLKSLPKPPSTLNSACGPPVELPIARTDGLVLPGALSFISLERGIADFIGVLPAVVSTLTLPARLRLAFPSDLTFFNSSRWKLPFPPISRDEVGLGT
jgi:hypothetical protein